MTTYATNIVPSKQSYYKEIRELLKSRGQAKKLSGKSINEGKRKHLSHRIKKLDRKSSDYNSQVITDKIGFNGTISKQHLWKTKRMIATKSVVILYSLADIRNDEISDFFLIWSKNITAISKIHWGKEMSSQRWEVMRIYKINFVELG